MFGGGFPGFFHGFGQDDDDHHHQEEEEQGEIDNETFYKVLGLQKNATDREIKAAYKKACVKGDYKHPDRGGDVEKFKLLNEAYTVLSDPEKRKIYNTKGIKGLKDDANGSGDPFGDIFSMFGGGGGKQRGGNKGKQQMQKAKGKRIQKEVELEDVYKGTLIKFKHLRQRNCQTCHGKGGDNIQKCSKCKGQGQVVKTIKMGFMIQQSVAPCDQCKGEGEVVDAKSICSDCKGKKVYDENADIEVSLEPGTPHEYDQILTGESDEAPNIMAGDLHVRIMIKKHKIFSRKGGDLYIEKKITLLEALTGFHGDIQHLDGKKLTVSTAPDEILSNSDVKCIKGKGMPFWKDSMSHGNLYIKFEVEFPKKGYFKNEQIQLLQKILPGPKQRQLKKDDKIEYLDEYYEDELNSNPEGGRLKDEEEEDDERLHGGGQRVQCSQQ